MNLATAAIQKEDSRAEPEACKYWTLPFSLKTGFLPVVSVPYICTYYLRHSIRNNVPPNSSSRPCTPPLLLCPSLRRLRNRMGQNRMAHLRPRLQPRRLSHPRQHHSPQRQELHQGRWRRRLLRTHLLRHHHSTSGRCLRQDLPVSLLCGRALTLAGMKATPRVERIMLTSVLFPAKPPQP